MTRLFGPYLTALSFLTRMAPPRHVSDLEIAASVAWLPAVGITMAVPLTLLVLLPLAQLPWVAAWLFLAGGLWLTRGLHYDGVADLADAWGSRAEGERFYAILKDSRLGAFGAMGLFLVGSGQLILCHEAMVQGHLLAPAYGLVFGRFAAVCTACAGRHLARPGLAASFLAGATFSALGLAALLALPLGCLLLGPKALALTLGLLALVVWGLRRLASRVGGMNGDFLGTSIVLGELCACLGAVLA